MIGELCGVPVCVGIGGDDDAQISDEAGGRDVLRVGRVGLWRCFRASGLLPR